MLVVAAAAICSSSRATYRQGQYQLAIQHLVCMWTMHTTGSWVVLVNLLEHMYSAFNLEEPFLCFVVNKYVLCSEKVTIVAIGLKFAMSVHTSFCSVCRKSGLTMLVDSKVVAACVPGIGLQL